MKKKLSIIFAFCMTILLLNAQDGDDYSNLWETIMSKRCAFQLVAYGDYFEGKEITRYYPEKDSHEGMVFTPDRLFHIDAKEGDILYEAKIDGYYLRLSNKSIMTRDERTITDYRHSSWIKILKGTETEEGTLILITVDSYGIYRYLEFVGIAKE